MVDIVRLNNGLRLVVEEIPHVRSVSMGFWVFNGSRNETPDTNGISHFIEHMTFKGTQRRSAKDIAEEMDSVGGQINAYTTKEYTCYHTRVLDKHFDIALDILSDMFLHSRFDQKDIAKECNIILEEINMYQDAPEELVHDALQEAVWHTSSLGLPILGTKESIVGFDSKMIRNYWENHYTIENTVISIAGNIKKEEAFEKVNSIFGIWNQHASEKHKMEPTIYHPAILKNKKDVEQVHLCMSMPSFPRDSQYKYALSVLNTIFGGGMSSRLFQKIREDNGLTYAIYSYISSYGDAGLFSIYAGMSKAQAQRVIELIAEDIRDLKTNGISNKVINITKEQIISNYIIGTESTVNRMTSSGSSVLLRNKIQTQEEIIAKIELISESDIDTVIHKIFDYSKLSISVAGNVENLEIEDFVAKTPF